MIIIDIRVFLDTQIAEIQHVKPAFADLYGIDFFFIKSQLAETVFILILHTYFIFHLLNVF